MRLDQWLAKHQESRSGFARRVGLSPASITQLCNDGAAWVSRETAERILAATNGAVTPNDFLRLADSAAAIQEARMSQSRVAEAIRAF
eukprot:gene27353-30217_t